MSKLDFKIGDIAVITGDSNRRTWIDEGVKVKVINADKDDQVLPYHVQIVKGDCVGETDWVHHTALASLKKKVKKWKKVITKETRKLLIGYMGKKITKLAIERAIEQFSELKGVHKDEKNPALWLTRNIVWSDTKEGDAYWREFYHKML